MGEKDAQPLRGRSWDGIFRRQVSVDQIRSIDESTRSFDVIASTDTLDSHGDVVEQNFDLTRYKKNGVVLWYHNNFGFLDGATAEDYLPIGKSTNVRIRDGQLEARISLVVGTAEEEPLVDKIWRRVQQNVLRAVSIGFRPTLIHEEMTPGGVVYHLDENELYEISVVPIPSNPDAVAKSVARERDWMKSLSFEKSEWKRAGAIYTRDPEEDRGAVAYYAYPPNDQGEWNKEAALERVRIWASDGGEEVNWAKYKSAFAWYDSSNPESFDSYKLLHHDVLNGGLVTVKDAVVSAGNAIQGARGANGIPSSDVPAVKQHLEKHYAQFGLTAPWHKSAEITIPAEDNGQAKHEKNSMTLEQALAEIAKLNGELAVEKANKTVAETKLASLSKDGEALAEKVKTLESDLAAEKKVSAAQTEQLKAAGERAVKAEAELGTVVIDGFVGKKITPAEKQGIVELAFGTKNADGTLKEAGIGLARVKSMLESRPDLAITQPVETVSGEKPGSTVSKTDNEVMGASASLVEMANKAIETRTN